MLASQIVPQCAPASESPKRENGVVKSADDNKLDVEFEKAGFKRVLDNYVETVAGAETGA